VPDLRPSQSSVDLAPKSVLCSVCILIEDFVGKTKDRAMATTAYERRELVEGHALFEGLSRTDLDNLLARARVEYYPAGRKIFEKGSPGRSMMAILRGSVRISAPSVSAQRELVFTTLQAGEIFGEIAILDGQPRTADATAVTDCELLVLDRREFVPFLERRPEVSLQLLKVLCHRLRLTNEHVEHAVFEHLNCRLARTLLHLASTSPQERENFYSVRVSQQELADMVGATRESVNKRLRGWQNAGVVRLESRLIVIKDIAAIEALI
jgi:CRP/FNR family transcriptional regulator, cyclic AMP receptor protein